MDHNLPPFRLIPHWTTLFLYRGKSVSVQYDSVPECLATRNRTNMKKSSDPMAFLARAKDDDKLSRRLIAALERGGQVTASEVLDIAQEFGFSFTRAEFEAAVKRDYVTRFAAGDQSLADVAKPK